MSQTNPPVDPASTDPVAGDPNASAAPETAEGKLTLTAGAMAPSAPQAAEEGGGGTTGG